MTSSQIPIVDFGQWLGGGTTERERIARGLTDACRRVGFAYVTNHGLDNLLVEEAFDWSRRLFQLPMDKKMLAPHPPGSAIHRGYSWPGLEKVSQSDKPRSTLEGLLPSSPDYLHQGEVPDIKESFEVGSEFFAEQPNVWLPEHILPGFPAFMQSFYWTCFQTVAKELLSALAMGLGLSRDETERFLGSHTGMNNQLRLLHYPPVETSRLVAGEVARMPAHSDWGTITMLFQDGCGGLQVEDPGRPGSFVDAVPVTEALVMNVGDALMRWSNDHLKSTLHRVSLPHADLQALASQEKNGTSSRIVDGMTRERYSIPYFVSPDPDAVVECFASCTSPEKPARYAPFVYEDYRRMRAKTQYADASPTSI